MGRAASRLRVRRWLQVGMTEAHGCPELLGSACGVEERLLERCVTIEELEDSDPEVERQSANAVGVHAGHCHPVRSVGNDDCAARLQFTSERVRVVDASDDCVPATRGDELAHPSTGDQCTATDDND